MQLYREARRAAYASDFSSPLSRLISCSICFALRLPQMFRSPNSFGQSFVREQIEEETLVNDLLDKLNLATRGHERTANLYDLDRDVSTAAQDVTIPQDAKL